MSSFHFKEPEKNKKAKLTSVQVKQGSLTIKHCSLQAKNGRDTTSQIFQGSEVHFKAIA